MATDKNHKSARARARGTCDHWSGRVLLSVTVAAAVVVTTPGDLPADPPSPVLPKMITPKAAKAIDLGLKYLVKTQRNNGSWFNTGGYGIYPAVMSALGGMALMAGGSTPESGPHAKQVKRAMNYLMHVAEAKDDGLIAGPGSESRSMYGHGFSMLFLAQCYGTELTADREKRLKKILDKAVALTAKAQSKLSTSFPKPYNVAGGWIYTPSGRSDEGSVTVTQLQALRACRNVGIKVPQSTINKSIAYLRHCQNPDGGISYSASSRGGSRPALSAAAIACFYAAGVYDRATGGKGLEAEMVEKLVRYAKRTAQPENHSGHYFYTQFYMAQAMYQRGGKDWKTYFPKIRDKLLGIQNPDWSWQGDNVGTTYGTAIATIILQLPYAYLPICQR